jgi:hypothetical protein
LDFNTDQHLDSEQSEEDRIGGPSPKIMLVPVGMDKPIIFQRRFPLKNVIYTSNSHAFYPTPPFRVATKLYRAME